MRSSILIMIATLTLGGCAGRQEDQQTTTARSGAAQPAQAQEQGMHGHGMHGGMGHQEMAGMCPMGVPGTSARTEDTTNGVAVVFTTTGDVNELRRRVAHMADVHNQGGHAGMMQEQAAMGQNGTGQGCSHGVAGQEGTAGPSGTGQGGSHGIAGPSTAEQQKLVASTEARAEDIEGGARLVLTPREPRQLTTMRERMRLHAQQMATEQCPMMSSQGMMRQPGTTGTTGQPGSQGRPTTQPPTK